MAKSAARSLLTLLALLALLHAEIVNRNRVGQTFDYWASRCSDGRSPGA